MNFSYASQNLCLNCSPVTYCMEVARNLSLYIDLANHSQFYKSQ